MSLAPTNKSNPCLVCENANGKCRQGKEDQNYWQCMTYADANKGEVVGGYKCIGHTRDKLWGQFKLDNTQEWSEERRREWQSENQRRKVAQARVDEQRQQQSLSAVERHQQYTKLLAELTLHPDDRADLITRGFTDAQITLSGFKSINRYQQLQSQYSSLLPGVNSTGTRLIIQEEGYLCPIRNTEGFIVACQVRLRSLPTTETPRYKWLSGAQTTLHLYPEGSKPQGELPLPVFRPQEKPEGIALAEGTGAKPFLVAQRLNLFTIGAAGGQWASSLELFREILEKAASAVGKKEILIFPDAGDILNSSVMSRWQRVIALLGQWGWLVKVAWWGQTEKSRPDIDELTDFSSIEYISPEAFWKIAKGDSAQPQGFSPNEPQWKVKARAAWRKNRQFHADIKEATFWCSFSRPAPNTIAFYKAGLGRGKTTRLRAWVKDWKRLEDVSFLCLGYRNTLLLQLCGDKKGIGFYHLHEHSGMTMKSAPGEGIALCVDSLWRFSPEDFDDKIIILDEVKSVIKHLLHSPTVKNRDQIINLFGEAIRRARQVICLDGLMSDLVVDYLHSLAPEKQIIRAENTYLGEKPRLNFLLGTVGTEGKTKVNDRSPWLKYLLEDAQLPAVCSDSQVMIESLDDLLSAKGLNVLRVDSKTVPEQHVKDFLLDCDAYIEQHRPDVLLYTPSAESGVDVAITNHFTHHFAFFFGVIDVDGMLQMIGRIRDNITKFVWCKSFVANDEKQHSNSPFTQIIAESIHEILIGDITSSLDDNWLDRVSNHLKAVIANSLDENFRTSCVIKSVENYEKSHLRECLREVLVQSGYKVVDCTLENHDESKEKVKEATEQVKRQNSADIFNAEKVSPDLVDELKFDATWEERCKVIQAKLRNRLPGIEDGPIWSDDFIYLVRYGDRNFINSIENYWLFTHPDVAKRQSQDNLHWLSRRLHTFIGNVKSRWARIHALREMKFERFLDPDKEWSNESPELIALVESGKKYSNPLGKHPGKSTPVQFLGNLLGLFGLKLKSRKDNEGKRWYRLNQEVLNDPVRQQVLACVEKKLSQPKEEIDWEAAINEAHGVETSNQPKTQSEQGLNDTAPSPQVLYTNQVEGAVNNLESQGVSGRVEPGVTQADEPMTLVGLIDKLADVSSPDDFAAAVEGCATEMISDAIAMQDTQPKRSQLSKWYEELSFAVESGDEIPPRSLGGRFLAALRSGAEALRELLAGMTQVEAWTALSDAEKLNQGDIERLPEVAPDWISLMPV